MTNTLHTLDLQLAAGELLRWQPAAPIELQVLSGRAWVTQSGDDADHFVAAGGTLRLRAAGVALIEAEAPLRLRLFASGAAPVQSVAARWQQWLHRLKAGRRPPATVAG
jgi:hypothetical protein